MTTLQSKEFVERCWRLFHAKFTPETSAKLFYFVLQAHQRNLQELGHREPDDREAYKLLSVLMDAGLDRDESKLFLKIPPLSSLKVAVETGG